MVLGEDLAGAVVAYFKDKMGNNVSRDPHNKKRLFLLGVGFTINVEKNTSLEVKITPPVEKEEEFNQYFSEIQTEEFWENPDLDTLKAKRKKYRNHLQARKFYLNSDGYHFTAKFATTNDNRAFRSLMAWVIQPAALFHQLKKKEESYN